jgi:hypothetical protein
MQGLQLAILPHLLPKALAFLTHGAVVDAEQGSDLRIQQPGDEVARKFLSLQSGCAYQRPKHRPLSLGNFILALSYSQGS